jgi:Protein of unknown function (DUF3089)
MYNFKLLIILFIGILFLHCASRKPTMVFDDKKTPAVPNYSDLNCWAAHPDKEDPADKIPAGCDFKDVQKDAQVDVFFIHPTTMTYQRGNKEWNADVQNAKINKKTDNGSILYQASIFNGAGRVFAPRYRQAHFYSYFTDDKTSATKAFDLAYSDIKAAFESYLKNWNNNRPIIIATHSQGTQHGTKLLKDFFDGKPLKNRLVIAYILGLPVKKNEFVSIPLCENENQTGCFCSWRTFKTGYEPKKFFPLGDDIAVVNPLSWNTDSQVVLREKHKNPVLIGFKLMPANMLDVQIHKGILWVNKPQFKGSFLYRTENYHVGDFNLFYMNVREDVERRVGLFWK